MELVQCEGNDFLHSRAGWVYRCKLSNPNSIAPLSGRIADIMGSNAAFKCKQKHTWRTRPWDGQDRRAWGGSDKTQQSNTLKQLMSLIETN